MKNRTKLIVGALVLVPALASAQEFGGTIDLIRSAGYLVDGLIILVMGIAVLVFLWGLVRYIVAQGSENDKIEAKKVMGWALVAIFVMVSIWGLVRFIQGELLPGEDFSAPPILDILPNN